MGKAFLTCGPSQLPFSISDTFCGINLIKIEGNFEEISLVQKPFFSVSGQIFYTLSFHCQKLQNNSAKLYIISPLLKDV